jgi:hypothetical protein
VWVLRADSTEETVCESFDYNDMPTYSYDSATQNPEPESCHARGRRIQRLPRGVPGDAIHFVCDVNDTSPNMLRFAHEVQTGKLYILFGARIGAPLVHGGREGSVALVCLSEPFGALLEAGVNLAGGRAAVARAVGATEEQGEATLRAGGPCFARGVRVDPCTLVAFEQAGVPVPERHAPTCCLPQCYFCEDRVRGAT